MSGLKRILNPQIFQGNRSRPPYFEGWYFRLITPQGRTFALIPGVSVEKEENEVVSHGFVQFLDSKRDQSGYFPYPFSDCLFSEKELIFTIGPNFFSKDRIELNMSGESCISGEIHFENPVHYQNGSNGPGIMGPFACLPFMECRHDVITVKADVSGTLQIDGESVVLDGSCGYIEKDWGTSFPEHYIWMQSCAFRRHNASFMLSAAKVPLLGKTIKGLLSFLYFDGRMIRLATYNGARVLRISEDGGPVNMTVRSPFFLLKVAAECPHPEDSLPESRRGVLKAPVSGKMIREIRECMNGRLTVELRDKDGILLFRDESENSGLEFCGDIRELY